MKKLVLLAALAAVMMAGCEEKPKNVALSKFEVKFNNQTDTVVAEYYEWTNYCSVLEFKIGDKSIVSYRAYDVKSVKELIEQLKEK